MELFLKLEAGYLGIALFILAITIIVSSRSFVKDGTWKKSIPIVFIILGIFIGARLGHCLFYDFEYYSKNLLEIILPIKKTLNGEYKFIGYAGLASHGGTIGLIISLYLYSKKYKIKYSHVFSLIPLCLWVLSFLFL